MNAKIGRELFEICLTRLDAGENLQKILADYPTAQEDLLPLMRIAQDMRDAAVVIPPAPRVAQARSKARFLQAAGQPVRARSVLLNFFARLNYAAFLGVILLVCIVGGIGVNIVAAQALPGDALYSLKLANEQARLALAGDDATRLQLEEEFNHTRQDEVKLLLDRDREAEVRFEGVLERRDGGWRAAGIRLELPSEWMASPILVEGNYVEVRGLTQPGGSVLVTELRLEDGGDDENQDFDSSTKSPEATRDASDDSSGANDGNETPSSSDDSSSSGSSKTHTPDLNSGEKTQEPTRTLEPTRTEEPSRTPEPTRTKEPTRTPEPTQTPKP